MNKKSYLKPSASYIVFYSKEELTAELDINDYINETDVGGDVIISANIGIGGDNDAWID